MIKVKYSDCRFNFSKCQMNSARVVIVPGNGSGDVEASNWYGWLRDEVSCTKSYHCKRHDILIDSFSLQCFMFFLTFFFSFVFQLEAIGIEAFLRNMPDPLYARESQWLPFMKNQLKCDENTVIVGHR